MVGRRDSAHPAQLVWNFVYLSGAEAGSKLLTFAAVAYLAHVVGPVSFGYVEYAAAVLLCAALVVDQGFGPFGAREIAKTPSAAPELVQEIVTARVLLAVGAYVLVIVPAALLARYAIVSQLLLLYGVSLVGTPLLLQWVFQGNDRMGAAAAMQPIRQAVFAVVVFALVRTAADIWFVAVAELAGVCAAAAYCGLMTWRSLRPRLRLRPRLSRRLFREGVPIGISQLFWTVRMFGATLIVGAIAQPEDVGLFAAAQRILVALHAFIFLYYFNLLPSLARSWREQPRTFGTLVLGSLRSMLWLSLLIGLVWVLLAPSAMSLIYGSAFEAAGANLQWLAGMWLVAAISGHYRFGLIAAGRQKAEMVTSMLGAAVAIVFVPVGYLSFGLGGTGIALLTAEVVIWLSAWWWARRTLELHGHAGVLARPAIAAALALGVGWLLPLPVAARVGVSGVLLALLALALESQLRRQVVNVWKSLWLLGQQARPRAREVV